MRGDLMVVILRFLIISNTLDEQIWDEIVQTSELQCVPLPSLALYLRRRLYDR